MPSDGRGTEAGSSFQQHSREQNIIERYSEILWHSASDGVLSAADLDELIARGADVNRPCLNVSKQQLDGYYYRLYCIMYYYYYTYSTCKWSE